MENCFKKLGAFKLNMLLFIFLQFSFARPSIAVEPPTHYVICAQLMSRLLYLYERGSLGLESDPFRAAGEGQQAAPQEHPQSSFRFESDALAVLEQPPGFREAPLQAFASTWGLTRAQAVTVLDYYSSRLFYADLEPTGSNRDMAYRLQALARGHWLGDVEARVQNPSDLNSSDRLALRYRYYLLAVTRSSVPEMAHELRITEHRVYHDLSELQLSIELSFREPLTQSQRQHLEEVANQRGISSSSLTGSTLDIANHLIERLNWSVEDSAQALGLGLQALRFIRHATHPEPRGVTWNRTLEVNGTSTPEENILRHLHESGETAAAIANRLNHLSNTTDPTSPLFRTENSVSVKLRSLHLSTPRTTLQQSNIQIAPYGFVKLSGRLTETPVVEYLIDHYDPNSSFESNMLRLSQPLGVTSRALEDFIERHTLVLTNAPALERLRGPLRAIRTYAVQLTQRHSALVESTFQRFGDLTGGGGIAAFREKTLEGFSTYTQTALISLAAHLSPGEKTDFESFVFQIVTNKKAGNSALGETPSTASARRQIFNALVDLIERHNRWVAENPSQNSRSIALSELQTENGMRGVIYKLTCKAQYVHPQILERFSNLNGSGGITAFRGANLKGFSANTQAAIITLAAHLSPDERMNFESFVLRIITNRIVGQTALQESSGAASARRQIFNALADLIERHNRWVAENPSRRSRTIELSELETETGMRGVLYKLTQRAEFAHPQILERFSDLNGSGGIVVFRTGTLDGFSTNIHAAMISLGTHLSPDEKRDFETLVPQLVIGKNAGQISLTEGSGASSARRQIFNALADLIERHNRWVAENPSRNYRSIAFSELQTENGMRGVLYKLTQRAEFAHPQILERFSNLNGSGGIAAFREGTLTRFDRTQGAIISLAAHLSPDERREFEELVPVLITNRTAGTTAVGNVPGANGARRQIFNALADLIERHNRWVDQDPSRRSRAIVLSELDTEAGMREVLRKLRGN